MTQCKGVGVGYQWKAADNSFSFMCLVQAYLKMTLIKYEI